MKWIMLLVTVVVMVGCEPRPADEPTTTTTPTTTNRVPDTATNAPPTTPP
jgi:hypothetical protein